MHNRVPKLGVFCKLFVSVQRIGVSHNSEKAATLLCVKAPLSSERAPTLRCARLQHVLSTDALLELTPPKARAADHGEHQQHPQIASTGVRGFLLPSDGRQAPKNILRAEGVFT